MMLRFYVVEGSVIGALCLNKRGLQDFASEVLRIASQLLGFPSHGLCDLAALTAFASQVAGLDKVALWHVQRWGLILGKILGNGYTHQHFLDFVNLDAKS